MSNASDPFTFSSRFFFSLAPVLMRAEFYRKVNVFVQLFVGTFVRVASAARSPMGATNVFFTGLANCGGVRVYVC